MSGAPARRSRGPGIALHAAVLVFGALSLVPLLWMLSASFISTVIAMKLPGPGTIYAGQTLQFRAPVFIGDTVTATVTVSEKLDERKWLKLKSQVHNQDGKLVVDGESTVIPPKN